MRELLHTLRGRLMLLMLVAALPAYLILLFAAFWLQANAVTQNETHVLSQARILAAQHQEHVDQARRLLAAMAQVPDLTAGFGVECGTRPGAARPPGSGNVGSPFVIDASGDIRCQTARGARIINVADRAYFQRALRADGFGGGDYVVSRISGEPAQILTHTVRAGGKPPLILAVALDMVWLRTHPMLAELPAGAAYLLFDQRGALLLRQPDAEKQGGRGLPDSGLLWRTITDLSKPAFFSATGLDGRRRLFAYAPLGSEAPFARLLVGVPEQSATREAMDFLQLGLLGLVIASVLGLLLGWWGGAALVLRPMQPVFAVVRRLAAGDLAARTGGAAENANEIGLLAVEVDRMAEALTAEKGERQQAEDALRRERDRVAAYLDVVGVMVVALDPRGRVSLINRKACELLGCAGAGGCQRDDWFAAHVAPETRDAARAVFEDVVAGRGEVREYDESEVLGGHGGRRLIAWHNTVLRDRDGAIVGTLSAGEDITAREQASASLRESEARYRSLFDNMLEGIAHCRMIYEDARPVDFIYLEVNAAFEAMRGLAGVLGKKSSAFIPSLPESNPELFALYGRVASSGKAETCSAYIEPLDRWFSIAVYSPRQGHFIAIFDNITQRKRAEQHLRATQQMLRLVTDTIPHHVFWKDRNSRFLGCNIAFARSVGVGGSDDVIGKTAGDLIRGEHAELYRRDDLEVMESGVPKLNYVEPQGLPDGRTRWLETSKLPLRNEAGLVIGVLGLFRDITETRRLEEEGARLQLQLQQAQKMEALGQLTGGIAHDFNNILGSVLGFSKLALRRHVPDPDSPLAQYLREVIVAGERARDLVAKMLAFSRARPGGEVPVLAPAPVIEETLKMLTATIPASIRIDCALEPDPPGVAMAPVDLHQILMNLVINARDAMDGKGRIEVSLRRRRVDGAECAACHGSFAGDYLEMVVADTGPGIAPEVLPSVFAPFFTTKEVGKGTGMGLAMVHGLLCQAGGHVLIDSRPGEGAAFHVYLPTAAGAAPASAPLASLAPAVPERRSGRVLVVDDEAALCRLLTAALEADGWAVQACQDPCEALALFRADQGAWHAVITDQAMPGLTGVELMAAMRALRPAQAVILCTGYSDALDESGARAAGASHFFHKPVEMDVLLAALREVGRV